MKATEMIVKPALSRSWALMKAISVEPLIVLFFVPSSMFVLLSKDVYLTKTCEVQFEHSQEECANRTKALEKEAQHYYMNLMMYHQIICHALNAIVIIFVGAWSDRRRRRIPCMLAPLVGMSFMGLLQVVNLYWWRSFPVDLAVVLDGVILGVSGNWPLFYVGVFSYIGDHVSKSNQTNSVSIVNNLSILSCFLGLWFCHEIKSSIGLYGVCGLAAIGGVLGLVYGYAALREVSREEEEEEVRVSSCGRSVVNFFSLRHVVDTFKVTFKKTLDNRRLKMAIMIGIVLTINARLHGE